MENPDYLFLDIILSKNALPGFFAITFYKDKKKVAEYPTNSGKEQKDHQPVKDLMPRM